MQKLENKTKSPTVWRKNNILQKSYKHCRRVSNNSLSKKNYLESSYSINNWQKEHSTIFHSLLFPSITNQNPSIFVDSLLKNSKLFFSFFSFFFLKKSFFACLYDLLDGKKIHRKTPTNSPIKRRATKDHQSGQKDQKRAKKREWKRTRKKQKEKRRKKKNSVDGKRRKFFFKVLQR